jgi:predicted DNA-binding ribbon-helix-helix protein
MRDKETILRTLAEQRAELERRYRAMPADVLASACTDSEAEGGERWTPKDHLAHLLRIEEAFLAAARRTMLDEAHPIRFSGTTREEILAGVHRDNEEHVAALRDLDVEHLLAKLEAARQNTLNFISTLDEDALDKKIPGAPWNDGTIGGVLMTNAHHELQHLAWVDEGLAT